MAQKTFRVISNHADLAAAVADGHARIEGSTPFNNHPTIRNIQFSRVDEETGNRYISLMLGKRRDFAKLGIDWAAN